MAGSRQEPCARLRRSRETSRQVHWRTCHHTGRHFGGRNRSGKRGSLQSSVPGCSAAEGSEELGPTESRGRHRSECDRRPPRTANGCCCGDVVRRFHTERAVSYIPQNRAPLPSLSYCKYDTYACSCTV